MFGYDENSEEPRETNPEVFVDRNDKMIAIDFLNTQRHRELIRLQNTVLNNIVTVDKLTQWKINSFHFEEFECNVCGSVAEKATYGGLRRSMEKAVPSDWRKFISQLGLASFCLCDSLEDIVDTLESEDSLRENFECIPLFAARTWSYQSQNHEGEQ